jgi:hypothetical protein
VIGRASREGVEVIVRWIPPDTVDMRGRVTATFTPLQPGFHLYSAQLPPRGIQGVGRPTRLEVGGALRAVGQATADQTPVPLRIDGVARPVSVYPDGPVTMTQAVTLTRRAQPTVRVTYAACSSTTCLPPVTRHAIAVDLPDSA